jgi:hypothetical protein
MFVDKIRPCIKKMLRIDQTICHLLHLPIESMKKLLYWNDHSIEKNPKLDNILIVGIKQNMGG